MRLNRRFSRRSFAPPQNVKKYVPWVVGGIAVFLALKFVKGFSGLFRLGDDPASTKAAKVDFAAVKGPDTTKMTITPDKAIVIANQMYNAMHPRSYMSPDTDGTDEDLLFDAFKQINNRNDMLAVYKAFGIRTYVDNYLFDDTELDLIAWVKEELSDSDYAKIASKIALI